MRKSVKTFALFFCIFLIIIIAGLVSSYLASLIVSTYVSSVIPNADIDTNSRLFGSVNCSAGYIPVGIAIRGDQFAEGGCSELEIVQGTSDATDGITLVCASYSISNGNLVIARGDSDTLLLKQDCDIGILSDYLFTPSRLNDFNNLWEGYLPNYLCNADEVMIGVMYKDGYDCNLLKTDCNKDWVDAYRPICARISNQGVIDYNTARTVNENDPDLTQNPRDPSIFGCSGGRFPGLKFKDGEPNADWSDGATVECYDYTLVQGQPPEGLIAHLPLNSSTTTHQPTLTQWMFTDLAGSDNNGTCHYTGSVSVDNPNYLCPSYTPGHSGLARTALKFDGINDYIEVTELGSVKPKNATVMAWIKYDADENSGNHKVVYAKSGNYDLFVDGLEVTVLDGRVYCRFGNGTNTIRSSVSASLANPANWNHIACVANSSAVNIYVNGELKNSAVKNLNLFYDPVSTRNPTIGGALWGTTTRYFNGSLSDFKFYSKALNFTEINEIYTREAGPYSITRCIVINQPGTYTLAGNLNLDNDADACIWINSSNVILDGDNKKIDAKTYDVKKGIYVGDTGKSYTNVIIKNITLANFTELAIYALFAKNLTIIDSKISDNTKGIYLESVNNSLIKGNVIVESSGSSLTDYAIRISYKSLNYTILNNKVSLNRGDGLRIFASHDVGTGTNISNNEFCSNTNRDLYVYTTQADFCVNLKGTGNKLDKLHSTTCSNWPAPSDYSACPGCESNDDCGEGELCGSASHTCISNTYSCALGQGVGDVNYDGSLTQEDVLLLADLYPLVFSLQMDISDICCVNVKEDTFFDGTDVYALNNLIVGGVTEPVEFCGGGLVAHLPLNSSTTTHQLALTQWMFTDLAGSDNNGTCHYTGSVSVDNPNYLCPSYTPGYSGLARTALKFDGANDYINITGLGEFRPSEASVLVWIKYDSSKNSDSHKVVYAKSSNYDAGVDGLEITVYGSNVYCRFGNGTATRLSVSASLANPDNWNHIACVANSSAVNIYVNGELKNSAVKNLNLFYSALNTANPTLGGAVGGINRYFNGSISEFKFYGGALTSIEIGDIYEDDIKIPEGFVINQCRVINQPGTYTLAGNLNLDNDADACIWINSSNVILDGKNKKIDARTYDVKKGIYVGNSYISSGQMHYGVYTNVIIKNITLTNFTDKGIHALFAKNLTIIDSKISDNTKGIYLESVNNSLIKGNVIVESTSSFTYTIQLSNRNLNYSIQDNKVFSNNGGGLMILSSADVGTGTFISNNEFCGNANQMDLYVYNSSATGCTNLKGTGNKLDKLFSTCAAWPAPSDYSACPVMSTPCTSNEDCPSGQECVEGVCVTPGPTGFCGDGEFNTDTEECDDRNAANGECVNDGKLCNLSSDCSGAGNVCDFDGCSKDCTLQHYCGNNVIEAPNDVGFDEQCDTDQMDGFTDNWYDCNATCSVNTTICNNNGAVELRELCDGNAFASGLICDDFGYEGCTFALTSSSTSCNSCVPDTTVCNDVCNSEALCGNGVINTDTEECDGPALDDWTCSMLGESGTGLKCDDTCTFDTSDCDGTTPTYTSCSKITSGCGTSNYQWVLPGTANRGAFLTTALLSSIRTETFSGTVSNACPIPASKFKCGELINDTFTGGDSSCGIFYSCECMISGSSCVSSSGWVNTTGCAWATGGYSSDFKDKYQYCLGKCSVKTGTLTVLGDCSRGDSAINVDWETIWTSISEEINPTRPDSCKEKGSLSVNCPSRGRLPFFTLINLLVSALAIAGIYFVWKRK